MYTGWVYTAISTSVLFAILDCVDGNLARAEKKQGDISNNAIGPWLDACSGYFFYAFVPVAIGLYYEKQTDLFGVDGMIQLISSLVAISNLLLRLLHQKLMNEKNIAGEIAPINNKNMMTHFKGEIGFLGFMIPAYSAAFYLDIFILLLIIYLVIYCGGLLRIYTRNLVKNDINS
jgi:phosphatidylglycerophosphate synthase